jgi:hypothetical protein
MEMPHALTRVVPVVDDQPEVVAHPALPGDPAHRLEQAPPEWLVVQVGKLRDVPPRHDEDVERGAREDIVDGHDIVVLVNHRRGDLAGHDATEEAVIHAAKRIPTWR